MMYTAKDMRKLASMSTFDTIDEVFYPILRRCNGKAVSGEHQIEEDLIKLGLPKHQWDELFDKFRENGFQVWYKGSIMTVSWKEG